MERVNLSVGGSADAYARFVEAFGNNNLPEAGRQLTAAIAARSDEVAPSVRFFWSV